MSERRQFDLTQQADVTVVVLCKSRYADVDVIELESSLLDLVRETQPQKLLIDMHALEVTTNAIHSVLLKTKKLAERHGGKLKLCSLTPLVIEVFQMLHLVGNIFEIYDSVDEALAAFSRDG